MELLWKSSRAAGLTYVHPVLLIIKVEMKQIKETERERERKRERERERETDRERERSTLVYRVISSCGACIKSAMVREKCD
jgi:hypothetical protein